MGELLGKRIMITRPRAQAGDFTARLTELGAEVIQFPTIRIVDPTDPKPLRAAVAAADEYEWIVFTSVNGVERFWGELADAGLDTRFLHGVSLCAIGPATAAAIEMHGARADLIPEEYVAEAVVEALSAEMELRGSRILLPRAEVAREVLPEQLRARGARVDEVPAYRTLPDESAVDEARRRLEADEVDVITFTSSSTVRNFVELIGTRTGHARVASIGPITSATAREVGMEVAIEAEEYTVEGLVEAILRHFAGSERRWRQ